MASKLDQSLDDITKSRRQSGRNRARGGRSGASRAPVGGIRKNRANRGTTKPSTTTGSTAPLVDSKIIVSGLPPDVTEANIKEYFSKSAGPVKKVMLTYNQNGTSRGIASIIFTKPETAAKAAKELNGLLVDGRPMKIELVVDATHVPEVPAPKPLTERVAQPKSQPKAATTSGKPSRRGRRPGRRGRNPRKKTVEELDAEMVDYFANNENANTNTAEGNTAQAQPATNGNDVNMDEIS
ncbi:hypothetical protein VTN31DRAFT_6402 [Thermomyces dupontii]|uniref:uncharacterized protein n=1 Tax=Talaromyces thermophilus TaxID=28565 RepID=UPI0037436809